MRLETSQLPGAGGKREAVDGGRGLIHPGDGEPAAYQGVDERALARFHAAEDSHVERAHHIRHMLPHAGGGFHEIRRHGMHAHGKTIELFCYILNAAAVT